MIWWPWLIIIAIVSASFGAAIMGLLCANIMSEQNGKQYRKENK